MARSWIGLGLWLLVMVMVGCGSNNRGGGGSIFGPPGGNGNNSGGDTNSASDTEGGGSTDGSTTESDGNTTNNDSITGEPDAGGGDNDSGGGSEDSGNIGEDIVASDSTELDTSGPECSEDNDCGAGFVCKNGNCLPDQPGCTDACTPAATKCTPDATGYVTCIPLLDGCFGWGATQASCPAKTSCVDGECKETAVVCPPTACLSGGAKQCSGNAVQTCSASAANPGCNEWKTTENCGANATCTNGVCITPSAGSCADVYDCFEANQCESIEDQCAQACIEDAGATGQQQFNAYASCTESQCGAATSQAEFNYCMLSKCKTSGKACFPELGTGTGDCMAFYECVGFCSDGDDPCVAACVDQTSWDGLIELWDFQSCAEKFCEGLAEQEFANCVLAECFSQAEQCFPL